MQATARGGRKSSPGALAEWRRLISRVMRPSCEEGAIAVSAGKQALPNGDVIETYA